MNYSRPALLDALAAEYVLGTLRGGARRRFAALLREQPAARAAVAGWEHRLLPLTRSVPAMQPRPQVWQNIRRRTADPTLSQHAHPTWWENLFKNLFKISGGALAGAALTAIVFFMMPQRFVSLDQLAQQQQTLPQSYVGLLTDATGQAALLASATRHGTKMTVKLLRPPAALGLAAGTRLQLWAFPSDPQGNALPPFVVGTLTLPAKPGNTEFTMPASSEKLLTNVKRLAVALETPANLEGAQSAQQVPQQVPQEFLLRGHCVKLW